jgi:hypothetical protein
VDIRILHFNSNVFRILKDLKSDSTTATPSRQTRDVSRSLSATLLDTSPTSSKQVRDVSSLSATCSRRLELYPVHTVGPSVGPSDRPTVRVCVRVSVCPSFGPSFCLSDNFSDANPDATSDRPSDGPDSCPTFSRRSYSKNNDHVSPLATRRHGSKMLWQILGPRSWGHRTCCNTVLVCWHCCLLI